MPPLNILYEDNHLLAVFKPTGVATMGLPGGRGTLLEMAKEYIRKRYHKPGNAYLGVVSRLDLPVSGVVLFARTSKAARRLTEQFRTRTVRKSYWAMVEGKMEPVTDEYVDWIGRDDAGHPCILSRPGVGAKEARLIYRRLSVLGGVSLLEIEPKTGRKHQIRLQLANRGHAILGDRKYGSLRQFAPGIALHARRLVVDHPVKHESLVLEAPVPATWARFGVSG